jgi:DNA polymerase elongation subunit (family B)
MTDTIKFNILDWTPFHSNEENDKEVYNIRLFGRTEDGKTVHVKLVDYTPFFFVEIPETWTPNNVKNFVKELKYKVYKDQRNSLISYDIVKKKKFVGFTNGKLFTFIRLVFTSYTGMLKYSWVFKNKICNRIFTIYESNIEPFMRCMHIRNLQASGWVTISEFEENDESVNCDINVTANWTKIHAAKGDNIAKFVIASYDIECISVSEDFPLPEIDGNNIIQIGTTFRRYGEQESFYKHLISLRKCGNIEGADVESYETEAEVLLAWKRLIDRMNPDIVTGYNIFGFDDKYVHVRSKKTGCSLEFSHLGRIDDDPSEFKVKELSSAALGDNKMCYYDMIGRVRIDLMKVIMRDHNLSSYTLDNVAASFIKEKISDIDLVKSKSGEIRIKMKTENTIGLEKGGYISIVMDDGLAPSKLLDKMQKDVKFKIIKVEDNMLKVGGSIERFELIEEYLNDKKYVVYWCQAKDEFNHRDMRKLYDGTPEDRAIIGKYCIKDCELVNFLFAKLEVMANNIGMSNVCSVPLSYIFMRGQGVKALSLVAKKCRQKNSLIPVIKKPYSKDKENEFKDGYEGAIVFDPVPGIYFTPITVLDYASLYPSSMIEMNLSHDMIVQQNEYDNLENVSYHNLMFNNTKCIETTKCCEHGTKEDCKKDGCKKFHCKNDRCKGKEHTIFESRKNECDNYKECDRQHYTNKDGNKVHYAEHCKLHCIMHCMEMHCVNKDCDHEHEEIKCNLPGCKEVHCVVHCRFAHDKKRENDNLQGIIVEILKDLLGERKATKKLMKVETDKFKKNILDGLQAAYKVTANSMYGQIGSTVTAISYPQIAAAVTSTGRDRLRFAKDIVEDNFDAKVMYGDTDSIFIKFNLFDENGEEDTSKNALIKSIALGEEASKLANEGLSYPHNLEYEKVLYPLCILKKKKYVGNLYEHDPNYFKQKSMGIVLKRRDNANIVKIIVGGIVDIVLNERDFDKALEFTKKSIEKLLKGEYPIDKFIITKTLKNNYKDPTQIAHKVLADRIGERDPGNKPQVNERIPFVYIKTNGKVKLQGDKIEHPDFVIDNNLEIDYLFYLTNQIMNPAVQFLELKKLDAEKIFYDAIYREENKRKKIKDIGSWFKPSKSNSNKDFDPNLK